MHSIIKQYRTKDGCHDFKFRFVPNGSCLDIYCLSRPSLHGRDPSVVNTHLYEDGKICFVAGHEPRDQRRAEQLAAQWAEYFLEYRRTGVAQH